ncbi:ATP synthase subunit G atp20 [Monascus purpureus]|uniref:ATP synthase subunit G atp20 n=1 Tax=Monascus purpureus TaxID=5098 RepID=A0A507R542_MONPU|nr:ATP synthase subunit G atp20 [Monascus purpureus]BDD57459.1 hypothetical protein MAP00_002818 [Monascus purpureus]
MPVTASRAVLRQSQFLTRRTAIRHASTGPEASKAKEAASSAVSKASEGLSRVTASAGPILSNATQALRKVGGRTGKVISFVDSLIPPTVYYSKVAFELAKLVFRGQNMYPPNLATFQSYFQPLINAARNPATIKNLNLPSTQGIVARVRNANKKEIAFAGVTAAEVIGFFTVGEIIGRMNFIGYKGEAHHDH